MDYVRVYQAVVIPAPPTIPAGGITNAASFHLAIAPGSLATIFGSNLSSVTVGNLFDSASGKFPTAYSGTSVAV